MHNHKLKLVAFIGLVLALIILVAYIAGILTQPPVEPKTQAFPMLVTANVEVDQGTPIPTEPGVEVTVRPPVIPPGFVAGR